MLKECMFFSRILPFKGLIYNTEIVGDISRCVCPPYDVIDDPNKYYHKSPYNAARIELPMDLEGKDRYEVAKDTLERWISDRVVYEDPRDSIYVLEQTFSFDGQEYKRLGFLSLLKLDTTMIFTHEKTKKGPKEDRERLLCSTKTFTSFIFGLYIDEEKLVQELLEKSGKELLYDFTDEGDIRCKLFRLSQRKDEEKLKEFMEGKGVYIADGHHRLEVAKRIGLAHIPIYLTQMFGHGTLILPYHRLIKLGEPKRVDIIWRTLSESMSHKVLRVCTESLSEIKSRLNSSQRLLFAVLRREEPDSIYIFEPDMDLMRKSEDNLLGRLKIQTIHEVIIKGLLGIEDNEIDFTPWFEKAEQLVRDGLYDMVFFCPPVTLKEVKEIAEAKMNMPPKSTYFFPKIPTGPVFYKYE